MTKPKRIIPQEIKDHIANMKAEIKYGHSCRALEMAEQIKERIHIIIETERKEGKGDSW